MKKSDAIALLGGTVTAAARAIGITSSAVSLWPDELSPRIADRVEAALVRQGLSSSKKKPAVIKPSRKALEEVAEG